MDLALGQVILLLVVSCLAGGASSETLKVSSTGDAARIQGPKMGDYILTSRKQHGHPVYKKTEGVKNYLYVSPNGYWTVGRTEGSTTSGLYNPKLPAPSTPPTSGWRYSDLPNGWKEDATLKVERKTASPADKPTADKPTADKPTADKPTADKPTADKPTADKPTADKPTAGSRTAGARTADAPTADAPTADAPTAPCDARLVVEITTGRFSHKRFSADHYAKNYAHKDFKGYAQTYSRKGPDVDGNYFYTYTKPTTTTTTTTKPTGRRRRAAASASASASAATLTIRRVRVTAGGKWRWEMKSDQDRTPAFAKANIPHLINEDGSPCPPKSGWKFLTGPSSFSTKPDPFVSIHS